MSCQCAFLTQDQFPQVYRTFVEAFADYQLDMSHVTERMLFNRAVKNGVDFESSVGVFDREKMVGVTLIGIGDWCDGRSAFDAGTGIIPAYRGRGLAKQMFDFAVPKLKGGGIEKFILEVLEENEPAIKAYRKAGFKVTRVFDCFELKRASAHLNGDIGVPIEVRSVGKDVLALFEEHTDWQPSWENSFDSIKRIPDEVLMLGAFTGNRCVGLLVYYPLLNWIMTLVVDRETRRKGIATGLLRHFISRLGPEIAEVRLNNVDHSDRAMLNLLKKTGFDLFASEFEMELIL